MEEFYIPSNGRGSLHCGMWRPAGKPRAVVQLIHGIAEHIARYDQFACFLKEQGYLVVADDHMGHGASIGPGGIQGYFYGGWLSAVADEKSLHDRIAAQNPDVPYYMFGHSMGSFLLRTYLYTYPQALDAAIISGTGWAAPVAIQAGLLVCRIEARRVGETGVSPVLSKMMFGGYNKGFRPQRTAFDWLTSVDEVVDAYVADPLCGFDATVGLTRDMLTGIQMNENPENLSRMPAELPVMFVSGARDPVGGESKGVLQTIDAFKRAGMRNVTIKIYPEGRHEMLNERNRGEVYGDILGWLEQQAKA